MCHDVTQSHLFLAFGGRRVQETISKKRVYHSRARKNAGEDREKKAAKIDNLIKLIIFFRWNHHFSPLARQPLTSRNSVFFCCIIVSRVWEDRAISQNMPTIVYQTNRYWLLAVLFYDSPDNTEDSSRKLISSLWHDRNVMSHLSVASKKNLLRSALHSLPTSQIKLN